MSFVLEIILSSLADSIFGVLLEDLSKRPGLAGLRSKLQGESPEKLAFQRALTLSYSNFRGKYPELCASFFDEEFLKNKKLIAELSKLLTPNLDPRLEDIGSLWRAQFSYPPSVGLDEPLRYLTRNLIEAITAEPGLKPFVDSRAFSQLYIIAKENRDQTLIQTQILSILNSIQELLSEISLRTAPGNSSIPERTRQVQLILDGEFSEYNQPFKDDVVRVLSVLLKTPECAIRILNVREGSIWVTVEIPEQKIALFRELVRDKNSKLLDLGLIAIKVNGDDHQIIYVDWPWFENRKQEIDSIISKLTNVAGDHFFSIIAAPHMGKTWLTHQIARKLSQAKNSICWEVCQVDLRHYPEAWSDIDKLLSLLFDLKSTNLETNIKQIAQDISNSGKPCLCLIDSAELLEDETASRFREIISKIYLWVEKSGSSTTRIAFIAASRRRLRPWNSIVPKPRFYTQPLTHFPNTVIEEALRKMARNDERAEFGNEWYENTAAQLYKATEGLPGLLTEYMFWMRANGYVFDEGDLTGNDLFDKLGRPYIDQKLLLGDSLVPSSSETSQSREKIAVLRLVLLHLSAYRLITFSHLEKLLSLNAELRGKLSRLNWSSIDLWKALLDTQLIEPTSDIWTKPYPTIRRLLFRYQHNTTNKQYIAHSKASQFYDGWWMDMTGNDRAIVLVECLWHQVEAIRFSGAPNKKWAILTAANKLFSSGIQPNHITIFELTYAIEKRMYDDEELQESTSEVDANLLDELVVIMRRSISTAGSKK